MENQIDIVKDIADGMIGIGGIPSNEEFYAEFDMRVRAALRIHNVVGASAEQLPNRCKVCGRTDEERLTMTSMCGVSACPY
jgi:hypothetical protein